MTDSKDTAPFPKLDQNDPEFIKQLLIVWLKNSHDTMALMQEMTEKFDRLLKLREKEELKKNLHFQDKNSIIPDRKKVKKARAQREITTVIGLIVLALVVLAIILAKCTSGG